MVSKNFIESFCVLCRAATSGCPANWLSHGFSCYALINTPLIWTAASQTCRTLHSELVIVDDASEHSFLNNTLRPLHTKEAAAGTLVSYWTSGNDLVKEGHWVWANNEEMEYNGWGPGEPNNARGANCLALHSIELFKFNDDYCNTSQNRFICEMKKEEVDPIVG